VDESSTHPDAMELQIWADAVPARTGLNRAAMVSAAARKHLVIVRMVDFSSWCGGPGCGPFTV
jgi:hypothetical protein